jgi:site-specific DNA-cytosine methylase
MLSFHGPLGLFHRTGHKQPQGNTNGSKASMSNETHNQLEVFQQHLADIGYAAIALKLKSSDYYLPQDRVRAYLIGLNVNLIELPEGETVQNVLEAMRDLVYSLVGDFVYDYQDFMLPAHHPRVEAELSRRRDSRSGDKPNQTWPGKHWEFLQEQGLGWSACNPPEDIRDSEWFQLLPHRERQIVGYWVNKDPACFGIDHSQSIHRVPRCSDATMVTLMPDAAYFMKDWCRDLLGVECLHMQGS